MFSLLSVSVMAIQENSNITQTQVNNINFDTVNLECRYNGINIKYDSNIPQYVQFNFYCLSLKRNLPIGYQIIKFPFNIKYEANLIIKCINKYTRPVCLNNYVQPNVQKKAITKVKKLREALKSFQTKTIDLTDEDFVFSIQ